jgi:hypothetical protein
VVWLYVQDILRLYQFVEKLVGIHMALSFYAGEHKDLIAAKYEEPLAVRPNAPTRSQLIYRLSKSQRAPKA